MIQAARVCGSACRNAITKTFRRNYGGGYLKPPTMNDMPVPKGDFNFLHAKRQMTYNMVLGLGAGSVSFGIFLYNQTDIVNFHFSPPDSYE